ncbi:MAG TPA: hypothetical protein PKD86_13725 [Gemmatales bacterium]|nr:hypothetical protein [Gemmatales bacterium]HMP60402.1 hypothetical protein [Gemmatales bacterium]
MLERLSQLTTQWSQLARAHQGDAAAQAELLARYGAAVYRYALATLSREDDAADFCQAFAVRFLRGDFRHARPERGRFRDYLRTALARMLNESLLERQRRERLRPFESQCFNRSQETSGEFESLWRQEVLDRAWHQLRLADEPAGGRGHFVLRAKADEPILSAEELARRVAERDGGPPPSVSTVRQWLHRARERFADCLLDEIAVSIGTSNLDEVAEELAALRLLPYCEAALEKRRSERLAPLKSSGD